MPLRCRVDSGIHLPKAQVPPKMYAQLVAALSVLNPALAKRQRLGLKTWSTPDRLYFLTERNGNLRLPRGAIGILRHVAAEQGVALEFDDRRRLPTEPLSVTSLAPLRDYQAAAVDELVAATQGTFVLVTGAGKTIAALGAIARLRTPTLILVGSRDLATQWRDRIRKVLGQRAGLVAGGELEVAPVTVALAQALARMATSELDAFLECFGFLVQDECHSIGAKTFHEIVDRCPARYRLGLTATPDREDGLTPLLEFFFGPPLAQVTHAELVGAGLLLAPTIRRLETDFDYPYTAAEDFGPMLDALIADEDRNRLIVDAVAAEAAAGQSCLVLSGRKDHCATLAQAMVAAGLSAAVLTSDVPKAKRTQLLDDARESRLRVVVATSLADEGLDVPVLSRAFLTFPSKAQGRTIQRLGRILRPHAGKKDAILIDFIDVNVPVLQRHAAARRCAYERVLGLPLSIPRRREVA